MFLFHRRTGSTICVIHGLIKRGVIFSVFCVNMKKCFIIIKKRFCFDSERFIGSDGVMSVHLNLLA